MRPMIGRWVPLAGRLCEHARVPRSPASAPGHWAANESPAERIDRRTFLRRSAAAGVALAGMGAAAVGAPSCSSDAPASCGLGAAGDIAALESAIGQRLRYQRIYHQAETFPGAEERAAWLAGRIPVVSFKTVHPDGTPIPFADVVAGAADSELRRLAAFIRPDGSMPMVLLYFPEPEDDVGDRPQDFAPAFRRVRQVMVGLGTGVQWGHTLSHGTYDRGDGALYYPGDDYVDLITCDGYNWCPSAGHGTAKETFDHLFTATNHFAERRGKHWLATEVGTWDDPAPGWGKAAWIAAMGRAAKRWPSLKGILWFDHDVAEGFLCDWKLEDTPQAVEAFAHLAADPYFNP
jgi:hypothetical protein